MAGGNNHDIWTRFVEANYLKDAMDYLGKCPTCNSSKDCNNYYCLHCKQGGLCPATFRDHGAHHRHAWLQVRRQSRQSAVDPEDLAQFISCESTKYIQKSLQNDGTLCYLRARIAQPTMMAPGSSSKPSKTPQVHKLKRCKGCTSSIHNSQASMEEFLVCSLECLIIVARGEPEKNLLRMNDGAMDFKDVFPQTYLEKSKVRALSTTKIVLGHAIEQPESFNTCGSAPSKAPKVRLGHAINQLRSSSAIGSVPSRALVGRGSSGRRVAPVDYRRLHEGGLDVARTGWGCKRKQSANRVQGPNYSTFPLGYRSEGLLNLIGAIQSMGDWDQHLGELGRD